MTTARALPESEVENGRVIILWFPDFPIYAVREELGIAQGPIALMGKQGVRTCSTEARAQGVRRGMRKRQAQAICSGLEVFDYDLDRDGRCFESFLSDVDNISAGIEVIRPGLVALRSRPLASYYGSEEAAIVKLLDVVARPGIDTFTGAADSLPAAILAARRGLIVRPGGDAEFFNSLKLHTLIEDEALQCPRQMIETLQSMGISDISVFSELPRQLVGSRFGADGIYWWDIVRGCVEGRLLDEEKRKDWAVTTSPDSPLMQTDTVAFLGRQLAVQLHERLVAAGLICRRLAIRAVIRSSSGDHFVERIWRSQEQLSENAIANRIRWQLDAWLAKIVSAQSEGEELGEADDQGLIELTLEPIELVQTTARGLWDYKDDGEAASVLARVQTMLGPDKVTTPVKTGGRGPKDRIILVPVGESAESTAASGHTADWVGQLPAPIPPANGKYFSAPENRDNTVKVRDVVTRLTEEESVQVLPLDTLTAPSARHPSRTVKVLDSSGNSVAVNGRARLTSVPKFFRWGSSIYEITGWAGPWPVDEQWWADGKRFARLQISTDQPAGFMLVCKDSNWRVEGIYA